MAGDLLDDLGIAEAAARAAAAVLAGAPRAPRTTAKDDGSVASDADVLAEEAIVAVLRRARPDDGILAEESGHRGTARDRCWIVDPIDGTANFVRGGGGWCVSVALVQGGTARVGVVLDPERRELFRAARGRGADVNGRALAVSACRHAGAAIVASGLSVRPALRRRQLQELVRVATHVHDVRCSGSAALDLAHVAAGRVDACFERGLQRWDVAAGELIVEEAGGVVRREPDPDGLLIAGGVRVVTELERLLRLPAGDAPGA